MKRFTRHSILLWVLAVTLAQGVVRLAVTPPFAHYDEPSHFEYLQFVAKHRAVPRPNQSDDAILNEIADTFGGAAISQNCAKLDVEPCLDAGIQFREEPGYYIVQSVAQLPLLTAPVRTRLNVARIVSVLLAMAVAALAALIVAEVLPDARLLIAGTPLVMAVNFAYVDLMSALNNDVGAVFAFTLLLYGLVKLGMRGLSWGSAALIAAGVVACYLSKSSAWIGVPLVGFAVLVYLHPHVSRPLRWGIALALLAAVVLSFQWVPDKGLLLRESINAIFVRARLSINRRLLSWYDWSHTGPAYGAALRWQFVSFWSAFATGQAGLTVAGVVPLALISGAGIAGLVPASLRARREKRLTPPQTRTMIVLAGAAALAALMSVIRIDPPQPGAAIYYIPTARHFYVAIVPAILLLLIGLGAWLPARYRRYGLAALILLLWGIGMWSLLNMQMAWFAAWPIQ